MRCLIHPTTILIYTSYQMDIYLRTACLFRITDDEMRRNNFDVRLTFSDRRNPPRKWEPVFQCSNASTVVVSCPVLRRPENSETMLSSRKLWVLQGDFRKGENEKHTHMLNLMFLYDSLDVESDGGNSSYGLVELQFVQDGWKWSSWTGRDSYKFLKNDASGSTVRKTLAE